MKRILILAILALALPWKAWAVPLLVNYQGRMTLSGGQPATGTASVIFSLYDAASVGNQVWIENQTVTPDPNGLFSVILGSTSNFAGVAFDRPYFLDINWAGTQMGPRQPFTTAPYAFRASMADNAVSATAAGGLYGAVSLVQATGGPALTVNNSSNIGIQGKGGAIGVNGLPGSNGGSGVFADFNNIPGAYALSVSGPARFFGGPVGFSNSVDFSGATVTGLSATVPVPLSLTGSTPVGAWIIGGVNNGAGYGLYGQNASPGSQNAQGNVLNPNSGVYGLTSATNSAGVFGESFAITATAGVAGRGLTGVYGESNGFGNGGEFQAISGTGADARGLTGVAGAANSSGGLGVLASDGGNPQSRALLVQGGAVFNGPVTFTGSVSGLGLGVSAPLSLTSPSSAAALSAYNNNGGPGVLAQGNAVGLSATGGNTAGVVGNSTNGNGVVGNSASSVQAGVYGTGNMGAGVQGTSISGYGVQGSSAGSSAAIYGSNSGTGPSVWGSSNGSGPGVQGSSFNGDGVFGSAAGTAAGLHGSNTGTGPAVIASSTGGTGLLASGGAVGVSGTGTGSASVGGYFQGVTGVVAATSSVGGTALYVSGAVKVVTDLIPNQTSSGNYALTSSSPAGSVTFSTTSLVTTISVTNPWVTPQSVILYNLQGAAGGGAATAYSITAFNGSFIVRYATSYTFSTGMGFNYLIIN